MKSAIHMQEVAQLSDILNVCFTDVKVELYSHIAAVYSVAHEYLFILIFFFFFFFFFFF